MNRMYWALALLMGATAFAVDASIPGIPATADFFGVEIGRAQLTIGMYILGYGLGQIPMGMLCDYYGRRPVALICMSLFVLCGVAASFSPNVELLVTARFFQGIFGASGAVASRAIARDITTGAETGRLLSLLTATLGGAMVAAPMVGAVLMMLFSWRAPFLASSVFGAMGVILLWYSIPETLKARHGGSLTERFSRGLKAFLHSSQSLFGAILVAMAFAGLVTVVTLSSEVFVRIFGMSELEFSATYAVASVGYILGGLVTRRLLKGYQPNILVFWTGLGFGICALGLGVTIIVGFPNVVWLITLVIGVFFCAAAMLSLATTIALEPLAKTAGMAAAIVGTCQLLFGAAWSTGLSTINVGPLNLFQGALFVMSLTVFIVSVIGYRMNLISSD